LQIAIAIWFLNSLKHDPKNPGAVGTQWWGYAKMCFSVLWTFKLPNCNLFLNSLKHDPKNPGAVGTTIVGICENLPLSATTSLVTALTVF